MWFNEAREDWINRLVILFREKTHTHCTLAVQPDVLSIAAVAPLPKQYGFFTGNQWDTAFGKALNDIQTKIIAKRLVPVVANKDFFDIMFYGELISKIYDENVNNNLVINDWTLMQLRGAYTEFMI